MSRYTSLSLYRPGPPPMITADDLSRFVAAIWDSGSLADDADLTWLHVKFGDAVDQDDQATMSFVETIPGIYETHHIDWDLDPPDPVTVPDMIGTLAGDNRRIYLASISLGVLSHSHANHT